VTLPLPGSTAGRSCASYLDRLKLFSDADGIVAGGKDYSYADIRAEIDNWRTYLTERGLGTGNVVTLEGRWSFALCAALFTLMERRAIVIPLTLLPDAKRAEFLEISQAEFIITIDDERRHCQSTGVMADHEYYRQLRVQERPGIVLFSSGTSGRSKATVLDFAKMISKYGDPKRPQRIMSFLSHDHIGGINTMMHTLSQGGTLVTVNERTPDQVLATIEKHRVEVLPTTPTFLNILLISGALRRYDTSSLKLITYGTEPMPLRTLRQLKAELPHVGLKQTYGLSELGILPTKSRSDDTLWIKLGTEGFRHKIVDNILWIKSDMAMLGYLNAPAPFDEDGFFNTEDVVEVDGEWVHVLGRRSEIINVGGEKVYPSEIENVLLGLSNIAEATVTGIPSHVTGMAVKATVKLVQDEDLRLVRKRIRKHCLTQLEPFKVPAIVDVTAEEQHGERFKKLRKAA
jgi:acyl-CoA synthetase (AMP-forming)/AMP-acid ligase II